MATQKLLIRNVSPNPILFNYQNSTDRIWYYQVVILPGQEKTIWCVENSLSYSGPTNGLFITNKTTTVCGITPTPTPSITPTSTVTPTPTVTPTVTPTSTVTPTVTPTTSNTPTPTVTPTNIPLGIECITFIGTEATSAFQFNPSGVNPSKVFNFGASYTDGVNLGIINSSYIGTIVSNQWTNYVDYEVTLTITGTTYGPYRYQEDNLGTGSINVPYGSFSTNSIFNVGSTYAIQISFFDSDGNDLTSLIQSMSVGDGIEIHKCNGVDLIGIVIPDNDLSTEILFPPSPTPSVTPTNTVTPSVTPSVTPTNTTTPTVTPTETPTPTPTPTI